MSELYTLSLLNDSDLVLYARLEHGALTFDSGPGGYTLTNNNTVGEATGKFDAVTGQGAADFGTGNTNKHFSLSGNSLGITNQNAFTIACWAKSSETPADEEQDCLFSFINNGYGGFFLRYYKPTGSAVEVDLVRNNGLSQQAVSAASPPGVGNWHHYAITVASTTMELFIDGVSAGSIACSAVQNGSTTLFNIGSNQSVSSFFDGVIDEVCVFKRVLNGTDIGLLASATVNYQRTYSETMTLSEVLARAVTRVFSEVSTMAEAFNKLTTMTFSDVYTITETFVIGFLLFVGFSDTMSLSEYFKKFKNGFSTAWSKVSKVSDVWTKASKTVGSWIKQRKQ